MLKDTESYPSYLSFLGKEKSKVTFFNSSIAYADGVPTVLLHGVGDRFENCEILHNSYGNTGYYNFVIRNTG